MEDKKIKLTSFEEFQKSFFEDGDSEITIEIKEEERKGMGDGEE